MIQEHVILTPSEKDKINFNFNLGIRGLEESETITGTTVTAINEETGEVVADVNIFDGVEDEDAGIVTQGILDGLVDEVIYLVSCVAETSNDRTLERSIRLILREE